MIVQQVVEPINQFAALINIYNIYYYLQVSLSLSVPGSCGVSATRFTSACSLPLVWRTWPGSVSFSARYLCISTISIYLRVYCLSIYISTWLGWAGPSARCPDISTFTRQIASNRQSLAINPRLISSSPSVGENVYLSSSNVNAALTYSADRIFPRH